MRHGRAKAARKTLRYFERTVNLKNKPYYSVLLDATFLIAMIRITSSNTGANDGLSESTIVSRIERVLQVNNGVGSSFSGYARDERLTGVVGGYDHNNDQGQNINSQQQNNNSGHHFSRFTVRYLIPQEVVDEIEAIIQTFLERSEKTKKPKKQRQYQAKSKVFEDALAWIKSNSSKKQNYQGNARCEVLPRLEAAVEPPRKKRKQKQQQETENDDETDEELATIGASDAVRRHIARDDGREDPETNQTKNNKQEQSPQQGSFTRSYIVASQEEDLLDGLRMLGTVPILRCANNASVLILENPSKKGQRTDDGREQLKWKGALQNPAERALVDAAWEAQKKARVKITGATTAYSVAETNQKRGLNNKAKGPNPLSCKRKRANGPQKQQGGQQKVGGSGESKSKKRRARAQRQKSKTADTSEDVSPKE
jgi:rRNA-processing protein FCF1